MSHSYRRQLLIFLIALIGDSGVQAFTSPVLRPPLTACRFKLASVTKSGARAWSMQSNNIVGNRFEDDGQPTIAGAPFDKCDVAYTKSGKIARRDINHLLANNKEWIKSKKESDPKFFEKLGSKHTPSIFWIGDADARLAANEIIGAEPGEVFVHRNIANQVNDIDVSLMSCLHYGVDVLKVEHIIVCGLYQSNAIDKIFSTTDFAAPLENWLSHIRTVYRLHKKELDGIKDDKARIRRLVELNVIEQCLKVYQLAVVQRRRVQTAKEHADKGSWTLVKPYATPRIHAVVYDVETGLLKRLRWVPDGLEENYGLYEGLSMSGAAAKAAPQAAAAEAEEEAAPVRRSFWQKLIGAD